MDTPSSRRLSRMSVGPGDANTPVIGLNDDEAELRRSRARRKSFGAPLAKSPGRDLASATMSDEQLAQMYQSIIKLSVEDKINQKNSWSLRLIDHMDDIFSTQKTDEGGTDFQKASCTLDASVKIYGYRVDDVWSTSYRVLENLNRTGNTNKEEATQAVEKGVSRRLCVANTIESNVNNITAKRFDLEFDVDPLFHKMSKAFDEGGAKGMLMNNLTVHAGCKLGFDSVDVADEDSIETREEADGSTAAADMPLVRTLHQQLQDLCRRHNVAAETMEVCPALDTLIDELQSLQLNGTQPAPGAGVAPVAAAVGKPAAVAPTEPVPAPADQGMAAFDDADYGNDGGYDDDGYSGGFHDDASVAGSSTKRSSFGSGTGAVGTNAVAAALCDAIAGAGGAPGAHGEYAYFDEALLSKMHQWAGPTQNHWKLMRAQKAAAAASASSTKTSDAADGVESKTDKPKKRGERKEKPQLNFLDAPIDVKKAFAPPPRSATATQLSAAALKKADPQLLLLPLDMHFKVADLTKLMTNPTKVVALSAAGFDSNTQTTQGQFATVAAARGGDDAGGFEFAGDGGASFYDRGADGDADGGGGFDDYGGDMADHAGLDSTIIHGDFLSEQVALSGLVEPAKRVETIRVNYDTEASKVDVRQLKERIWKAVSKTQPATGANEDDEEDEPQPAVSFMHTVNSLSSTPASAASVPFYFICMLHLANEKNLALEGNASLSDFTVRFDQ